MFVVIKNVSMPQPGDVQLNRRRLAAEGFHEIVNVVILSQQRPSSSTATCVRPGENARSGPNGVRMLIGVAKELGRGRIAGHAVNNHPTKRHGQEIEHKQHNSHGNILGRQAGCEFAVQRRVRMDGMDAGTTEGINLMRFFGNSGEEKYEFGAKFDRKT